jgi:hypothetical protein
VVNVATVSEMAGFAGMGEGRARDAFSELSKHQIVTDDTFGLHRFPVILRRY